MTTDRETWWQHKVDELRTENERLRARADEIHDDFCGSVSALAQQNERIGIAEEQLAVERTLHNKTGGMLVDASKTLMRERTRADATEARVRELEQENQRLRAALKYEQDSFVALKRAVERGDYHPQG
jgi:hypothetical protein